MEYNKESLKQLLSQINTINEAYKIVKKNTGEDFNIFGILGMERKEVKTHSRILAELLDPKGSHLQGNIFLKLFIDYLNNVKINNGNDNLNLLTEDSINLNVENSNVFIEKYIGEKTLDTGGRIDISIEDSEGKLICIENKIDAGEQENQLLRYHNHCRRFKKHNLLFLTLDGKETQTLNIPDAKIYAISYKKHIVEWLELCKKETVNLPILRESIGQYINLIKKITNQTTNVKMAKDIVEIIADNSKNFESSKLIKENFDNSFGIISTLDQIPEKIILSFDYEQGKFIKTLPIHHSQKVLIDNDSEYRIELTLVPTYDFYQELLTHTGRMKIISPENVKIEYFKYINSAKEI